MSKDRCIYSFVSEILLICFGVLEKRLGKVRYDEGCCKMIVVMETKMKM
jgi:hypothetical protein